MKEWLKDAIFYEIYPQSFYDTNGDGVGDLNGIIEKLGYIRGLGFNAVWINPCFESPFGDAGYDVANYYKIAPRYGTNEDAKRLFAEAHRLGMRVILDLVPGHTSVECEWFKKSCLAEPNEYSGRYVWTDSIWTGIDGIPGISGTLRGISDRDGSCGVNFFSCQPALNYGFAERTAPWQSAVDSEDALATREAILDVIRFWLGLGCDGFRVDMAGSLVKNDPEQKETIKVWQDILGRVSSEFPEAAFVSEWGEPDKALIAGFDMDFLLHFGPSHYLDLFREKPYFSSAEHGDLSAFFETYMKNYTLTNGRGYICIPSGNHDMTRIKHFLTDDEIKLAYAFIMSMPGVPFIYYGDEIGMDFIEGLTSVEGGYNRTGTRTPMQWDDTPNAGFSSAAPDALYIPQCLRADSPNVKAQSADEGSLLNELKRIIAVRRFLPELLPDAGFKLISAGDASHPLVYIRGGRLLIAINPSDTERSCECDAVIEKTVYKNGGAAYAENGRLTVPPGSVSYVYIK